MLGKPILISSGYRSPLTVAHAIQRSGIASDQLLHEFDAWVHISFAAYPRAAGADHRSRGALPGLRALA